MHFVLQIPCRPASARLDRPTNCGQIGANSSEIRGFLSQRRKVHALTPRRRQRDASQAPGWSSDRRGAAVASTEATFLQTPAGAPAVIIAERL
jgi:hypothetical protein